MKRLFKALRRSLQLRIILIACFVAPVTSSIVGWISYNRAIETAVRTQLDALSLEAKVMGTRLEESLGYMFKHAGYIAKLPALELYGLSLRNDGVDPQYGYSDKQIAARIEQLFAALMIANPEYLQVRYIGLEGGGKELVRVERRDGDISPVRGERLQRMDGDAYFVKGLQLDGDEVAFSDVTLSRNYSTMDQPWTPTLRSLAPVVAPTGEKLGLLVIDADYAALMRKILTQVQGQHPIIVDSRGGYMTSDPETGPGPLHFAGQSAADYPAVLDLIQGASTDRILNSQGVIYAHRRLPIMSDQSGLVLDVLVKAERDGLPITAIAARTDGILIALILTMISLIATGLLTSWILRPLRQMGREVKAFQASGQKLRLPIDSDDEIGELARGFEGVVADLQESEANVRTIIDSTVDGLIVIDERGRVETFNPACEKIFGYKAEEVLGKNVKVLMPEPYQSEHDQYLKAHRDTGERKIIGIGREVMGRRKDGSEFPLDLSVSEMSLQGRRSYCGIVRDITERKQMERMKDEFVSTVNHELRTPLSAIHGSLNLLQAKSKGRLDARSERLIDLACGSCARLSALVNDILDIEKIAAGKLDYRMEVLPVCDLLRDIVNQNEAMGEQNGVRIELQIVGDEPDVVVDPNRFHQALVNLLSNACKFSPEGEVVSVRVETLDSGQVRISVEDNGPGIPEGFRDKVFERFAQADSSTTRKSGGSGLGLNITRSLIEAFGGAVEFETRTGVGTTFHIILPVHQKQKSEELECLAS